MKNQVGHLTYMYNHCKNFAGADSGGAGVRMTQKGVHLVLVEG